MLVYDLDRLDGRLTLTASTINQIGQYIRSPSRFDVAVTRRSRSTQLLYIELR